MPRKKRRVPRQKGLTPCLPPGLLRTYRELVQQADELVADTRYSFEAKCREAFLDAYFDGRAGRLKRLPVDSTLHAVATAGWLAGQQRFVDQIGLVPRKEALARGEAVAAEYGFDGSLAKEFARGFYHAHFGLFELPRKDWWPDAVEWEQARSAYLKGGRRGWHERIRGPLRRRSVPAVCVQSSLF